MAPGVQLVIAVRPRLTGPMDGDMRLAPDGNSYTKAQFKDKYGGIQEWNDAFRRENRPQPATVAPPVEREPATVAPRVGGRELVRGGCTAASTSKLSLQSTPQLALEAWEANANAEEAFKDGVKQAETLVKREEWLEAVPLLERALQERPTELKWQLMLASCWHRGGHRKEAMEVYEAVLRKQPDNVEALRCSEAIWQETPTAERAARPGRGVGLGRWYLCGEVATFVERIHQHTDERGESGYSPTSSTAFLCDTRELLIVEIQKGWKSSQWGRFDEPKKGWVLLSGYSNAGATFAPSNSGFSSVSNAGEDCDYAYNSLTFCPLWKRVGDLLPGIRERVDPTMIDEATRAVRIVTRVTELSAPESSWRGSWFLGQNSVGQLLLAPRPSNEGKLGMVQIEPHFEGGHAGKLRLRDVRKHMRASVSCSTDGDELRLVHSSPSESGTFHFAFSQNADGSKVVGQVSYASARFPTKCEGIKRLEEGEAEFLAKCLAAVEEAKKIGPLHKSQEGVEEVIRACMPPCPPSPPKRVPVYVAGAGQVWLPASVTVARLRRALVASGYINDYDELLQGGRLLQVSKEELKVDELGSADLTARRVSRPRSPSPDSDASWYSDASCFTERCTFRVLTTGGGEATRATRELRAGDLVRTGATRHKGGPDAFRHITRIWRTELPAGREPRVVVLGEGCEVTDNHPVKRGGRWAPAGKWAEAAPRSESAVFALELEGHVDMVLVGGEVCACIGAFCGEEFAAGGWNIFTRRTTFCDCQPCAKCAAAVDETIDFSNISRRDLAVSYPAY